MRIVFVIAAVLLFTEVKPSYGGQSESKPPSTNTIGRLLTPTEGCGYSKVAHKRIVGGSVAKNGAWPWMTLLYSKRNRLSKKPVCGGSLITSRHVLTAAHCILYDLFKVRLGEYDTRTTTDGEHLDVYIEHVEIHENFSVIWSINDIGMVHLEQDIDFNDRIRPVCLPITDELINRRFVNSNAFLVGWGRTGENSTTSPVPWQVQVPIIENKLCKKSFFRINSTMYNKDIQFDDRVVCEGFIEGGKSSCQGDSGGPLVLPIVGANGTFPFYQIGIVSYSEGCGRPNTPGVNTNVQYFAEWIKSKIDSE